MRLYNVDEVLADLLETQGVQLSLKDRPVDSKPMAVTKLFSEYISTDAARAESKLHVMDQFVQFLMACDLSICDVLPEDKFVIYGSTKFDDRLELKMLQAIDDSSEIGKYIAGFDCPYNTVAVWNPASKELIHLRRVPAAVH